MRDFTQPIKKLLRIGKDVHGKKPISKLTGFGGQGNRQLTPENLSQSIDAINRLTDGLPVPKQNKRPPVMHTHNATQVLIIHQLGYSFSAGDIVGCERPAESSQEKKLLDPVWVGAKPAKRHRGQWGVCLSGTYGGNDSFIASVSGQCWAKVYVADAAGAGMLSKWKFVDIDPQSTGQPWNLSLLPYGSGRVLWMDPQGGGYRWCLIEMHQHAFGADLDPYQVPEDGDTWSKWRHEMPDTSKLGVEAEIEFSDGVARKCRFDAKGHLVRICASDEAACPTPSPTPSATATPTGTSNTPTPTPADSGTPTPTPLATDCGGACPATVTVTITNSPGCANGNGTHVIPFHNTAAGNRCNFTKDIGGGLHVSASIWLDGSTGHVVGVMDWSGTFISSPWCWNITSVEKYPDKGALTVATCANSNPTCAAPNDCLNTDPGNCGSVTLRGFSGCSGQTP